mgnify:CR=1 FL=1
MVFRSLKKSRGQGTTEYLILIALMILVLIAVFSLAGLDIQGIYNWIIGNAATNTKGTAEITRQESTSIQQPTKTETGKSDVLFLDDFGGPELSHWSVLNSNLWEGQWNIRDGKAIGEPLSAIVVNNFIGSNYLITAKGVQLTDTRNSYKGFGIIFRADSKKSGDGYMFEYEKKNAADPGLIFFTKWIKGNQVFPPIASATPPLDIDWNSSQDVQVQVRENAFTVYINGQQVLTGEDNYYKEGTAGLSVNNGSTVSIEDFRIELLK